MKFILLGIIFLSVFLVGYLTIWKKILKPLTDDGEFPKTNSEPKSESKNEGETSK